MLAGFKFNPTLDLELFNAVFLKFTQIIKYYCLINFHCVRLSLFISESTFQISGFGGFLLEKVIEADPELVKVDRKRSDREGGILELAF